MDIVDLDAFDFAVERHDALRIEKNWCGIIYLFFSVAYFAYVCFLFHFTV